MFHGSDELLRHPEFDAAATSMVDRLTKLYAHDLRLRTLIEFEHMVSFQLIVCLSAAQSPDDPASWVTMSRLERTLPLAGVRTGRPITEWVNGVRKQGLLASVPAPTDKRVRILQPTEYMLELDREWLELIHAPLAMLYPDEDFDGALQRRPDYQQAYRLASLRTVGLVSRIMRANPGSDFFIRQSAGTRILMTLMRETREHRAQPTPPGFLTRAAEASGVSRTHVRNVLRAAEQAGFVRLESPRIEGVLAMPSLFADVDNWIADSLAGTSITHSLALRHAAEREGG